MTKTNIPAVVNEAAFEIAVETVSANEGWLIGSDGIVDPDGRIALLVSADDAGRGSEAGHGLVEWLARFDRTPHKILVHGEEEAMLALSDKLSRELGFECKIPFHGERFHF